MRHRFLTVDVFTDRAFGGNPLAVFPVSAENSGLSTGQMMAVTREFNLSETVFVLPPENPAHTCRLRIFTPGRELPFAGHPTVGTAFVLAAAGLVSLTGDETRILFEEGVGPVPVTIRSEGGIPRFTELSAAVLPEFGPAPPPVSVLAELLSLTPEELTAETPPEQVSCGVPFLFIPVRDRAALGRARVRLDRWDALYPEPGPELYLFSRDPELPGSALRARMFAPSLGIAEDPATGGAVTALGGYLGVREPEREGTKRWVVEQGFEMGRPSLLHLEVDKKDGAVSAIRVGGSSVLVSEGTMEIPEGAGE
jgi:trans-2,3-dihydro-3-hydroxyanthranilate isomerase